MESQARLLRAVAPLLLAVLAIGASRLLLIALEAPAGVLSMFSLTGIQIIAACYLPLRLEWEADGGFLRLWMGLLLICLPAQLLYAAGLLLVYANGLFAVYPEWRRELTDGPVQAGQVLWHLWLHFELWVVVLPLLASAVATPLLAAVRRLLTKWHGHPCP